MMRTFPISVAIAYLLAPDPAGAASCAPRDVTARILRAPWNGLSALACSLLRTVLSFCFQLPRRWPRDEPCIDFPLF